MRNELDNVIHNMMSMTPLQRITMARMAKTRIERYAMKMGLDKEKAENFIIYYFRLFVAADANCDYRERDLFNRAFETNFSEIRFQKLVCTPYDEAFVKKMALVTQKMPEDLQNDVATLGLVIMCVDNELTMSEERLLKKILTPEESLLSRISKN